MNHLILAAATLGLMPLVGCEKYALDRQMQALCEKDGGVRVYETVTLPPEMFDQNGDPFPGWRSRSDEARLGDDFRLIRETTELKRGDPMKGEGRLTRYEWKVVRQSDGKVLGEGTMYGRSGGDFVALGHFTSNSCPAQFGAPRDVIHGVFVKKGN
jgi:hypothetical protein